MNSSRLAFASARATNVRAGWHVALVALFACSDSSVTSSRPAAGISVTPPSAALVVGGSISLGAKVTNDAGEAVDTLTVFWSSSDASIASVDSHGVVTGHKAGEVRIAATSFGRSATATVRVGNATTSPPPQTPPASTPPASTPPTSAPPAAPPAAPPVNTNEIASIAISLSSTTLKEGDRANATAVLRNANGTILTGRSVSWTSSASSIANVTGTGSINAKKAGTTTITATSEGKRASVTLTVVKKK